VDNHSSSNPGWTSVSLLDNLIHSHELLLLPRSAVDSKLEGQSGRTVRIVGSNANIAVLNPSYRGLDSPGVRATHYARVEGIFHSDVVPQAGGHTGGVGMSERVNFLWVRWLTSKGKSMGAKGLDLLSLPPLSDSDASSFGFIDPQSVVQASHLLPKFSKENMTCRGNDSHPSITPQGIRRESKAYFLSPFVSQLFPWQQLLTNRGRRFFDEDSSQSLR
jgi:hypothetical protein